MQRRVIEAIEEEVEDDDENVIGNETLPSCKGSENMLDDYYSSRTDADDDDDNDDDDKKSENGNENSNVSKLHTEKENLKNMRDDDNKKKTTIVNKEIDINDIDNGQNTSHSRDNMSQPKPIIELIENEMLSNSLGRAGDVYRSLRNK